MEWGYCGRIRPKRALTHIIDVQYLHYIPFCHACVGRHSKEELVPDVFVSEIARTAQRPARQKQERDSNALTPREALFVLKVLELDNQTAAYLAAGYRCTRQSARANAARLIAKDSVQKALAIAHEKRLEAAEMKADEANRSQCTDPSMSRNGVLLEPTPAIGKSGGRQARSRRT
jgi:hypothetical protein